MKSPLGSYPLVALLICILMINIFDTFVPHHHHDGKIYLLSLDCPVSNHADHDCENNCATDGCLPGSDDGCHVESTEFNVPDSGFNLSDISPKLISSIFYFIASNVPIAALGESTYWPDVPDSFHSDFCKKTQKLRGSPCLL